MYIYDFDPITKIITGFDKGYFTTDKISMIDLSNDTVAYAGYDFKFSPLNKDDGWRLVEALRGLTTTPELMEALLASNYYVKVFLPSSLGAFNTPVEESLFLFFSSFVLPYEILYSELEYNPDYKKQILDAYDKNNSVFLRQLKEKIRLILVVPGLRLVCEPLIQFMLIFDPDKVVATLTAHKKKKPAEYL